LKRDSEFFSVFSDFEKKMKMFLSSKRQTSQRGAEVNVDLFLIRKNNHVDFQEKNFFYLHLYFSRMLFASKRSTWFYKKNFFFLKLSKIEVETSINFGSRWNWRKKNLIGYQRFLLLEEEISAKKKKGKVLFFHVVYFQLSK